MLPIAYNVNMWYNCLHDERLKERYVELTFLTFIFCIWSWITWCTFVHKKLVQLVINWERESFLLFFNFFAMLQNSPVKIYKLFSFKCLSLFSFLSFNFLVHRHLNRCKVLIEFIQEWNFNSKSKNTINNRRFKCAQLITIIFLVLCMAAREIDFTYFDKIYRTTIFFFPIIITWSCS
jgi:hypothetical protein